MDPKGEGVLTPSFLDHLVIEVRDIPKSLAFYVDILGLYPVRLEEFNNGQAPFVSLRIGPSLIDLFVSATPNPGPPHFCLTFDEPIQHIAATLRSHGIEPESPEERYGARGMGKSLYVTDPDGHTVELRSYHGSA